MNTFSMFPVFFVTIFVYLLLLAGVLFIIYRIINRWVMMNLIAKTEQNELLRELIKVLGNRSSRK